MLDRVENNRYKTFHSRLADSDIRTSRSKRVDGLQNNVKKKILVLMWIS